MTVTVVRYAVLIAVGIVGIFAFFYGVIAAVAGMLSLLSCLLGLVGLYTGPNLGWGWSLFLTLTGCLALAVIAAVGTWLDDHPEARDRWLPW